ncbi:putative enzyme related to lactoylglutathione lyase [Prauserella shujinwangii]|uniref:Putative enzyme related to lactoylglutathione lyase n=1 Tax=Prauserella shujinwangii TaxID=1453103 RepID=A0A2T0LYA2_9PSEU|nr:glyoxalase superfamily protein [Prauserella shujinwangii]PRX49103.1 putative enzyme related to lactoylglutathione lyase [Prauserella shujinwangii]
MAIRGVHKVIVGVRDQERAKRFWTEVVGFTVTTDAPYGDQGARWVEVTSPDGQALVLSEAEDAGPRPSGRDDLPTSNVFFRADDIERTHAELAAKGVDFPDPPTRQPWGWWATFVDSEGNRFALQQARE